MVIDNTPEETSVVRPSTAYLLTSAMEDVVKKGTGKRLQLNNMPVAGKTGTTDNYKNLWFAGYTPYYTCAVWAGYDDNTVLPAGTARTYQQTLWRTIMQRIHNDLPSKEFEMPSTVEKASICTKTGLLATYSCKSVTEYFDTETLPKKYCDGHLFNFFKPGNNSDDEKDEEEPKDDSVDVPDEITPPETPQEPETPDVPEVPDPPETPETPDGQTPPTDPQTPAEQ